MDGYLIRFEDGWHEMKAGAFWTTNADDHAQSIEYYTDTASAETFGDLVWARAFARGANLAAELVFVADGAHWIWRIVQRHFPHAIQVVDWFHASSYLLKIAGAAFGDGSPQAKTCLEPVQTALYNGHLGTVIRACCAVTALAPNLLPMPARILPTTAPACAMQNSVIWVCKLAPAQWTVAANKLPLSG